MHCNGSAHCDAKTPYRRALEKTHLHDFTPLSDLCNTILKSESAGRQIVILPVGRRGQTAGAAVFQDGWMAGGRWWAQCCPI
jgi:hypothetical protein